MPGPAPVRRLLLAVGLAGASAAALAGCTTASQVPWETYGPSLQTQVDTASLQHDCPALAAFHRTAVATSDAHAKATGFPNDALVAYIETAQRGAGCP